MEWSVLVFSVWGSFPNVKCNILIKLSKNCPSLTPSVASLKNLLHRSSVHGSWQMKTSTHVCSNFSFGTQGVDLLSEDLLAKFTVFLATHNCNTNRSIETYLLPAHQAQKLAYSLCMCLMNTSFNDVHSAWDF